MEHSQDRVFRQFSKEPLLKINVASGDELLDFRVHGEFSIFDDAGSQVLGPLKSDLHWRVKLETYEPAQYLYTILVDVKRDQASAAKLAKTLGEIGIDVRIRELGGAILLDNKPVANNRLYQVLVGEYNSREEAKQFHWPGQDRFDTEVIREKIRDARGLFEIFDAHYELTAKVPNHIRLVPAKSTGTIELFNIAVSEDLPFEKRVRKQFNNSVSFKVGDRGHVIAVTEVPLETYIEGVLTSVMDPKDPLEALKSQAVASRSLALANLGLFHPDDPYDYCSDSHCQLFFDVQKPDSRIHKAVKETRGQVLYCEESICETLYSRLCGGHTDENQPIHMKPNSPGLKSVYDGSQKQNTGSLQKESQVDNWVKSQPDVYCNPQLHESVPQLENAGSAFRWEVNYTRKDLEAVISKKTGEDIGTLFDIVPLKRGKSGRIKEIEILGSRKNIRIKKDMNIRQALSADGLQSSCFVIEKEMGMDGIPFAIRFVGAGLGHGAGLCQVGATVMAHEGKSYKQILDHYFEGGRLRELYG